MPTDQKTMTSCLLKSPERGRVLHARRLATTIEKMMSSQMLSPARPSSAPMPISVSCGKMP